MAITKSDFTAIPSSGIIPDKLVPASEFAVSYFFSYTGTPSLSTFNHSFSTRLVLEILDSNNTVKYAITILETYDVFIFPLAPGLALYTWNWVPQDESVSGTIGDGPDAPPMSTLGEGSFGVDPAEDSNTTDREVIVASRFYSKIFTEPLESGDVLKIKFHNVSAGFVTDRASLQLATQPGTVAAVALYDGRVGTTWLFYVDKSKVYCGSTRRQTGFKKLLDDALVFGGSVTYLQAGRFGATLHALLATGKKLVVRTSYDEGVTWMATFELDSNLKVLSAQLSNDGGAWFVYAQATATVISNDPDNPLRGINQGDLVRVVLRPQGTGWTVAELGVVEGTDLPTKNLVGFGIVGQTFHLMSNESDALKMYRSTDELKTLEVLPSGA